MLIFSPLTLIKMDGCPTLEGSGGQGGGGGGVQHCVQVVSIDPVS